MNLSSKFNPIYLIKIAFIPTLCIGISLLLIDVKMYYKKDIEVFYPVLFFIIIGLLVFYFNLKGVYRIILEENTITKTYFLSKRKEVITYDLIKSFNRERIEGQYSTKVGQISDGYYDFAFTLNNEKKLNVSPVYFDNYMELIKIINERRNELVE